MKVCLSLFISLISCLGVFAQSATEYFNVGNPIKYCDTEFSLFWSANPQEDYFVQEYLPQGETLEHYNQMFTVCVILWDISPLDLVQAKIAELKQRKKSDPVTNYMLAENNGEYILEFIVSDTNNDQINTVEVNVHHYKPKNFNGRNACILEVYSCRAYGDDIIEFIQSIPNKRNLWYDGMNELNLDPKFPKK